MSALSKGSCLTATVEDATESCIVVRITHGSRSFRGALLDENISSISRMSVHEGNRPPLDLTSRERSGVVLLQASPRRTANSRRSGLSQRLTLLHQQEQGKTQHTIVNSLPTDCLEGFVRAVKCSQVDGTDKRHKSLKALKKTKPKKKPIQTGAGVKRKKSTQEEHVGPQKKAKLAGTLHGHNKLIPGSYQKSTPEEHLRPHENAKSTETLHGPTKLIPGVTQGTNLNVITLKSCLVKLCPLKKAVVKGKLDTGNGKEPSSVLGLNVKPVNKENIPRLISAGKVNSHSQTVSRIPKIRRLSVDLQKFPISNERFDKASHSSTKTDSMDTDNLSEIEDLLDEETDSATSSVEYMTLEGAVDETVVVTGVRDHENQDGESVSSVNLLSETDPTANPPDTCTGIGVEIPVILIDDAVANQDESSDEIDIEGLSETGDVLDRESECATSSIRSIHAKKGTANQNEQLDTTDIRRLSETDVLDGKMGSTTSSIQLDQDVKLGTAQEKPVSAAVVTNQDEESEGVCILSEEFGSAKNMGNSGGEIVESCLVGDHSSTNHASEDTDVVSSSREGGEMNRNLPQREVQVSNRSNSISTELDSLVAQVPVTCKTSSESKQSYLQSPAEVTPQTLSENEQPSVQSRQAQVMPQTSNERSSVSSPTRQVIAQMSDSEPPSVQSLPAQVIPQTSNEQSSVYSPLQVTVQTSNNSQEPSVQSPPAQVIPQTSNEQSSIYSVYSPPQDITAQTLNESQQPSVQSLSVQVLPQTSSVTEQPSICSLPEQVIPQTLNEGEHFSVHSPPAQVTQQTSSGQKRPTSWSESSSTMLSIAVKLQPLNQDTSNSACAPSQIMKLNAGCPVPRLSVEDIVWGKVHDHPWWPGKILALSGTIDEFGTVVQEDARVSWFGSCTKSVLPVMHLSQFMAKFDEMHSPGLGDCYQTAVQDALRAYMNEG